MFWLLALFLAIAVGKGNLQTIKTKYVCPQDFHLVGTKCYHFSNSNVTWHDSHYYCLTINSTLAIVNSFQELNLLRDYINKTAPVLGNYERWIDGIYDWKQRNWKWGSSGQLITFNKFSRLNHGDKYNWNCVVLNPAKHYRWSARKCTDSRRFVCETETNTYIQFKLFDKRNKNNFNIAKCSNPEALSKYEKRKCLKLLGGDDNNEPAYLIDQPRPTKSVMDVAGFVCPPYMVGLGNRCYSFSKKAATWMDAHYNCKKNKSKLAIVRNRSQDYNLRIFLNNFIVKEDRWIGGMYDWKSAQWKWAITGQPLKYKGFAKEIFKNKFNESLEWSMIFMDPTLENRWNFDRGTKRKYYICQVKAKTVKKFGTSRIKPPQATIAIAT